MTKKRDKYYHHLDDEDDFTEEELADLYDLLGEFPELDGLDEILDYDDEDFYTIGN